MKPVSHIIMEKADHEQQELFVDLCDKVYPIFAEMYTDQAEAIDATQRYVNKLTERYHKFELIEVVDNMINGLMMYRTKISRL